MKTNTRTIAVARATRRAAAAPTTADWSEADVRFALRRTTRRGVDPATGLRWTRSSTLRRRVDEAATLVGEMLARDFPGQEARGWDPEIGAHGGYGGPSRRLRLERCPGEVARSNRLVGWLRRLADGGRREFPRLCRLLMRSQGWPPIGAMMASIGGPQAVERWLARVRTRAARILKGYGLAPSWEAIATVTRQLGAWWYGGADYGTSAAAAAARRQTTARDGRRPRTAALAVAAATVTATVYGWRGLDTGRGRRQAIEILARMRGFTAWRQADKEVREEALRLVDDGRAATLAAALPAAQATADAATAAALAKVREKASAYAAEAAADADAARARARDAAAYASAAGDAAAAVVEVVRALSVGHNEIGPILGPVRTAARAAAAAALAEAVAANDAATAAEAAATALSAATTADAILEARAAGWAASATAAAASGRAYVAAQEAQRQVPLAAQLGRAALEAFLQGVSGFHAADHPATDRHYVGWLLGREPEEFVTVADILAAAASRRTVLTCGEWPFRWKEACRRQATALAAKDTFAPCGYCGGV